MIRPLKVRHCICLIYWIAYSFNIYSSMRICHFQLLNISKMLAFLHFNIFLKNSYSCMEFSILQKLRGLSLMILSSEVKCFKICSTNFWNRKKICSYSSLPWFTYYKFKVSRNEWTHFDFSYSKRHVAEFFRIFAGHNFIKHEPLISEEYFSFLYFITNFEKNFTQFNSILLKFV